MLWIENLGIVAEELISRTDGHGYWLCPMLLDYAEFPVEAQLWWDRAELAQTWAGAEVGDEDAGWSNHVDGAKQTLAVVRSGNEHLNPAARRPSLMYWLSRLRPRQPTGALRAYVLLAVLAILSARCCCAMLPRRRKKTFITLFRCAEVVEAVRTEYPGEPYWQRVLEYAPLPFGLQAVLDEYTHLLRESLGFAAASPVDAIAEKIQ